VGLRVVHVAPLAKQSRRKLKKEALAAVRSGLALPTAWPAAVLESCGWSASASEVTIAVDTRAFADRVTKGVSTHLGFHGAELQNLVQQPRQSFDRFFSERVWIPILDGLAAAPLGEPLTAHVFVFCESGCGTSVGVATLIWEVACRATQWDVQLDHLSANIWWLATCNNCRDCQYPLDPRKEEAYLAAEADAAVARQSFDARAAGAP